jgi:hypothetical protein
MNKKSIFLSILSAIAMTIPITITGNVYAVDCEDIKGEMDWGSESHDDNNPSEKKFYAALEEDTFCEVLQDIDHMEIKGEIKEDSKHDMDWLEGTIFYQSVDEDSQDCMRDGYFNSPDSSGDDNLADYEMLECTY